MVTEGQRIADAHIRVAFLEWLPRPGKQASVVDFADSRGYDRDQVRRVCLRMLHSGEIVNGHPPSDDELATDVMRPLPRQQGRR
jgi:hypothetical protein